MKEYFYYLRDKQRRPVVTVCLLKLTKHTKKNGVVITSDSGNEVIVRGVAICSNSDDPCMKTGRNIAKGLALKAFIRRESGGLVVRSEAEAVLNEVVPSFWLGADLTKKGKYVFDPVLSMEERELTKDWIPIEATPETTVRDEPT